MVVPGERAAPGRGPVRCRCPGRGAGAYPAARVGARRGGAAAYTSRWGREHWLAPLQEQASPVPASGYHAAAVVIGRRALGHKRGDRPA